MTEPRIPSIPVRGWPPEMRDALAAMTPPNPRHERLPTEGRPKALNALGVLANHVELTHAFNTFNGHVLRQSTLEPRQRELLVLRVAHLRASEYEWRQHAIVGRDAGLTDDEIARIPDGPEGWAPLDAALLRAADELVAEACITDDTWAALAAELEVKQLMDVVFTVGAYDLIAMAFKSFGVQLDEDLQ